MKKKMNESKDIEFYLNLPYKYIFIPEESGGYSVRVKEFSGCTAFGETVEEAFKNIKESMKIWLSEVIKQNLEIPFPESKKEYSGKFLIRVPKSIHKKLVEDAEKEGISMNQYVLSLLSKQVTTFETYVKKFAEDVEKEGISTNQHILSPLSKQIPTSQTYVQKKSPAYKEAHKNAKKTARKSAITKSVKDKNHMDNKSLKTKKKRE